MAVKKSSKKTNPKRPMLDAPVNSPMGKFHKAMQGIITTPKSKTKGK